MTSGRKGGAQTSLTDEITVVLFAGGGGADTGISCATGRPVDEAVNHNMDAIRMHATNHPWTRHWQEDVFVVDPRGICAGRPCGVLWASPDCTHFSKARGDTPVKKEIRGLSWVIVKWAMDVHPRVMFMENVEEIRTWGPLLTDEQGRRHPDPARKGETFDGFIAMLTTGIERDHPALLEACDFLHLDPNGPEAARLVAGLGYDFEGRELVAADYGVPTIRKRFFGVFRRDGRAICFPEATHAPADSEEVKAGKKRPWVGAHTVIDWSIPAPSIFEDKGTIKERYGVDAVRPLADNTLRRVIRGVDKFTIQSGRPFLVPVGYGERPGQLPRVHDLVEPLPTVVGAGKHYLGQPRFAPFTATNTSHSVGTMADRPVHTVTSAGNQMLVAPCLTAIGQTGGGGDRGKSVEGPVHTQVSKAESCLVAANLIQYHTERTEHVRGQGMEGPVLTIDTGNRYGLAAANLVEYYGSAKDGIDAGAPMHTATSRDREGVAVAHIQKYFSGGYSGCGSDAEAPLGTVTAQDHNAVCLAHLVKFKGQNLGQHPATPLHTVTASAGEFGAIHVTTTRAEPGADLGHWPEIRGLLNQYCGYTLGADEVLLLHMGGVAYFISDIGLRMLTPRELYLAMGFPADYIIDRDYEGRAYSKAAQVARCGNAVCPPVAGALAAANLEEYALKEYIGTMAELWDRVAV